MATVAMEVAKVAGEMVAVGGAARAVVVTAAVPGVVRVVVAKAEAREAGWETVSMVGEVREGAEKAVEGQARVTAEVAREDEEEGVGAKVGVATVVVMEESEVVVGAWEGMKAEPARTAERMEAEGMAVVLVVAAVRTVGAKVGQTGVVMAAARGVGRAVAGVAGAEVESKVGTVAQMAGLGEAAACTQPSMH